MMLFKEVVELSGGEAQLEEVMYNEEYDIEDNSLTLLLALSLCLSASYSVEMCRRSSPNYAIPLPWSLLPLYLSVGVHLFYHEPK